MVKTVPGVYWQVRTRTALQGYLAHKKTQLPRTLQWTYA